MIISGESMLGVRVSKKVIIKFELIISMHYNLHIKKFSIIKYSDNPS